MFVSRYLVVARGAPALVQALAAAGAGRGGEAIALATGAARPSAVAVDLAGEYLYYCDVHRSLNHICIIHV